MASKKKDPATAGAGPEKVFKAGIAKDPEKFLYMVERNGDVVSMQRGVARAQTVVLVRTGIKRERGWMYYVDDDGDVSREPDND
jgi:hypothetical protein